MNTFINIEHIPLPIIVTSLWLNTSYTGPKGLITDKAYGFYLKEELNKPLLHHIVGKQKMSTYIDTLSGEILKIKLDVDKNIVDVSEYDEYHGIGSGSKCIENARNWYIDKISNVPVFYRIVNKIQQGFYTYGPWGYLCPENVKQTQYIEIGFPMKGDMVI